MTAHTATLTQITSAFRALSPEQQIMLIDHLGEHTDYADEIGEGCKLAAIAHGRAHSRADDEGDEAEAIAEGIAYFGRTHDQWKRHAEMRDRTLAYALREREAVS